MSDRESTPTAPRRSGRERKQVKQFENDSRKRKRDEQSENEQNGGQSDGDHVVSDADSEGEGVDEPDYVQPRAATRGTRGRKAGGSKISGKRKGKGTEEVEDGAKLAKDAKISDDNRLFNLILSPTTALQDTVDDLLESLDNTPAQALAELVNCFLRTCGCNSSIDSDQVMDTDGVVDILDDFTEVLKGETMPAYPLSSKSPVFRKFRKSLAEFINRLIVSSAELGSLYASDLMPTLQAWVAPLSSSQLRSFRHTATMIALHMETALCQVAASVDKELLTLSRQKEAERAKKGARNKGREQELDSNIERVRATQKTLKEYLQDIFNTVFVHRSRDHDATIRADCAHELGVWFSKHPAYFLESGFLPYLGKTLSDLDTSVRLEAVKSISSLYAKKDHVVALNHFTNTFKPRLIEMATSDVDISVRLGVINVLLSIDKLGLLEDDERNQLCLLIFGQDPRVRKAVAVFVQLTWAEEVDQDLVEYGPSVDSAGKEQRAGAKCSARLLIKWAQTLDKTSSRPAEDDSENESEAVGKEHSNAKDLALRTSSDDSTNNDRLSMAVEALWDEMEFIRRWNGMLNLLLMDHTSRSGAAEEVPNVQNKGRKKRPGLRKEDSIVEQVWRLSDQEEGVLLDVLVAALRIATTKAKERQQGERRLEADDDNASWDDITLALIKALPALFIKHQTDAARISKVLAIPPLMSIGMYLELRMINAYEALWDDVSKQFLTHSSPEVIRRAVSSMRQMLSTSSLRNINKKKLAELEEELAGSLRRLVGTGRATLKSLETAGLNSDRIHMLSTTIYRVAAILSVKDMSGWLEDDDGGKALRILDITTSLVERAKLGHQNEDHLIEQAISILFSYILWKSHAVTAADTSSAEGHALQQALNQQRDPILENLIDYIIGEDSQVTQSVKRAAFMTVIRLHLMFGMHSPRPDLQISMDEQVQYRFAGYIQAVIEEFAETLESERTGEEPDAEDQSDMETEDYNNVKRRKRANRGNKANPLSTPSLGRLEQDYLFHETIVPFIQAIRSETISLEHSAIVLAHFGRFGSMYDQLSRVLIEMLRTRWQQGDSNAVVSVVQSAMRQAFNLRINEYVDSEEPSIALARALSSHFIQRGAHLTILGRLPTASLVQIHTYLIDYIIKKLAEAKDDDEKLEIVASLFRPMVHLVSPGTLPTDTAAVKEHLERAIRKAAFEPSNNSKTWEGLHQYERKLLHVPKEKGQPGRKRGKSKKNPTAEDEDVENAMTTEDEVDGHSHSTRVPKPRSRPIRPRAAKSRASNSSAASSEIESEVENVPKGGKHRPRARDTVPDEEEPDDHPVVLHATPPRSPVRSSPSKASAKKRRRDSDSSDPIASPRPSQGKKKEKEQAPSPGNDPDDDDDFVSRKFKRIKR
ncbi:hypothetical protein FRC17_010784 [Serendipita sp. 399]|nr:hypothetical protein FRC17_010784 [Serendipita sp. 399]